MKHFLLPFATLLLSSALFSLPSSAAPVGKSAAPFVAPKVENPRRTSGLTLSVAAFGARPNDEKSDWKAVVAALAACKKRGANTLIFPRGRYLFNDDDVLKAPNSAFFNLDGFSDLTIDGQGSELIFHQVRRGFALQNCNRVLFRNFTVDWDIPMASPGVVQQEADGSKTIRVSDDFPMSASTPVRAITEYDTKTFHWKLNPMERYDPENVTLIRPQTFASPSFAPFPTGATVVIRHTVYDAGAFSCSAGANNISLQDVTIFGCPGMAFNAYNSGYGFRFTRVHLTRRDDPKRLISATADGLWFGGSRGGILIENCDIGFQGDDCVNIHGLWWRIKARPNARTLVLDYKWKGLLPADVGDALMLSRAADLREYSRVKIVKAVADETALTTTVTLDRDLPEDAAVGDFVANLNRANSNYLIRDSYFHDNRARGVLLQASNGLVENNRISRTMADGLRISTDANFWHEGFVAQNVTIRGNTLQSCGYAAWERGPTGRHMAALNIVVDVAKGLGDAPVHRNIVIENNTIRDTPGLAMLISSADGVTVRGNNIIDSNTQLFEGTGKAIDALAQGSIMVTRADNVVVENNQQSATGVAYDDGVFVDARNTKNVRVANNFIDAKLAETVRLAKNLDYSAVGKIDGVVQENGAAFLTGWAASRNYEAPLPVHLYLDGAAGAGGTFVAGYAADAVGDPLPEKDVRGANHRFRIALSPLMEKFGGRKIYLHAVPPRDYPPLLLPGSGEFSIPLQNGVADK